MNRIRRVVSLMPMVLTFALVRSVPVNAQTGKASWENLKQITSGQQIELVLNDAKSYRGAFQSVSDEGIVIRLATGEQTFARQSILRVSSKRQGHRLRNVLLGAAIGAGVGLSVGAAADRCRPQDFICLGNKGKAVATPAAGLVGAGIGAALPTGGWQEVYRAR